MSNSKSNQQFKGLNEPAFQTLLASAAKVGRDSNDPKKNPWLASKYQTGVPDFKKVHRGIALSDNDFGGEFEGEGTFDTPIPKPGSNLGIHWSEDKDIAQTFAEGGEGFGESTIDKAALYSGLIHAKDIEDPTDPETAKRLWNEHGVYPKGQDDDPEEERTAVSGSPILVTNVEHMLPNKKEGVPTWRPSKQSLPKVYRAQLT